VRRVGGRAGKWSSKCSRVAQSDQKASCSVATSPHHFADYTKVSLPPTHPPTHPDRQPQCTRRTFMHTRIYACVHTFRKEAMHHCIERPKVALSRASTALWSQVATSTHTTYVYLLVRRLLLLAAWPVGSVGYKFVCLFSSLVGWLVDCFLPSVLLWCRGGWLT